MDRQKLIGNLEEEVKKRTPLYFEHSMEPEGNERLLKSFIILTRLYDSEENSLKSLINYRGALNELKKVSKTEFKKNNYIFADYDEYAKKVKESENKIKSYVKTLAEFAEKYAVEMENSLDLFAQGKLAMTFGYSYHLPTVKAKAPKLNLGIAKLPQIEGNPQSINFANYWVESVSNKSVNADVAWDFIQFATKAEQAKKYLDITNKPTALRSMIEKQIDDMEIGIFAEQVLTATSWYKGKDANAAEKIIADMIDGVIAGQDTIENIITLGAKRVQQTIN